jgi:hypothetical protein
VTASHLDVAAMLALAGGDPWQYLTTGDPAERALLAELAQRADRLRFDLEKRLAVVIANAFVKARLYGG